MTACSATNRAGDPCRMPAQLGQPFCFTHNPANAGARVTVARSGGEASGATRRRIAHNRRRRREEAISLFNHSPRCLCLVCYVNRLYSPEMMNVK